MKKIIGWMLAVLIVVSVFPGCTREEATAGAEPTVTINEKGELTLAADLNAIALQSHAGQKAGVFELAPGETSIAGKVPLAETKVAAKLRFRFPLNQDGTGFSRLYSSYIIAFSDGTFLSQTPCSLSNAGKNAKLQGAFPRANEMKGLNAANEELSRSLRSAHTLAEVQASALVRDDGDLTETLSGESIRMDSILLAQIDRQVKAASDAGMQVSLCIIPDAALSYRSYAVLFHFLSDRYSGGENGTVSALLIGDTAPRTSQNSESKESDAVRAAELMRLAYLALTSHVANGRVYLCVSGTKDEVIEYAADAISRVGQMPFGVAFVPDPTTASVPGKTDGDTPYLNLSDLPSAAQSVLSRSGRSVRFAVTGLEFSAEDPDLQAALYSFAYRAAANAKADFLIYRTQADDQTGLYDTKYAARPAADAFLLADTAVNTEGESLAAALLGSDWSALKVPRAARLTVEDTANTGTTGDPGKRWFDFSGKQIPSFVPAGNASAPMLLQSESMNTQVLAAPLFETAYETAYGGGSGFRCTFENSKALNGIYVLSARILPQLRPEFFEGDASFATVTLQIDGTASDGRALSYTSSISLACNNWQTVSFHIRDYTAQMDASAPCTLTFLMSPDATVSDPSEPEAEPADSVFALWLHSVNTRKAAADFSFLAILLPILAGFAVAFVAVVLLTKRKKKRR